MATRVAEETGWREAVARGFARSWSMAGSIALAALAFLVGLALVSYAPSDAALNTAAGGVAGNWVGGIGAWTSDLLLTLFGPAIGLVLPLLLIMALRLWHDRFVGRWQRNLPLALLGVLLVGTALALWKPNAVAGLPGGLGGALGYLGAQALGLGIDLVPAGARWWTLLGVSALVGLGGLILWSIALELDEMERDWLFRRREIYDDEDGVPFEVAPKPTKALKIKPEKRPVVEADDRPPPFISVPDREPVQ